MGGGDSRRKLFLPRVLRGKHGNPVTREEGSALFKEARDISKFSLSFSVILGFSTFSFARTIATHKRDT